MSDNICNWRENGAKKPSDKNVLTEEPPAAEKQTPFGYLTAHNNTSL
jgi:hypothetical protein